MGAEAAVATEGELPASEWDLAATHSEWDLAATHG